ncbi:MAG: PIN domain-containing protein [Actinobacteria bacterium]|nr:PIN domain-containing protein [Actinomycetota bacterium]
MSLVLDAGPIVALLLRDDPAHVRCVAMVDQVDEDLVVPAPVLVEVDYWLRKTGLVEVWQSFVNDLVEGGYRLVHPGEAEVARAADLEVRYAELELGFVDAAVIALCERLGETKVATLDRRHFSVVRPRHCDALRLLPE